MDFQNFKSDLTLAKKSKVKKGTLVLSGELTIQNATSLKESLLDALNDVETCELDLTDVSQIDLAGIQVLFAAHKSALNRKKSLSFSGECPELLREAVVTSGLDCVDWLCFGQTK